MEQAIRTGEELRSFFFEIRKFENKLKRGVLVSTKIRKDILTGTEQGKIILEGRVKTIEFKNLTGGVYQAYID